MTRGVEPRTTAVGGVKVFPLPGVVAKQPEKAEVAEPEAEGAEVADDLSKQHIYL